MNALIISCFSIVLVVMVAGCGPSSGDGFPITLTELESLPLCLQTRDCDEGDTCVFIEDWSHGVCVQPDGDVDDGDGE